MPFYNPYMQQVYYQQPEYPYPPMPMMQQPPQFQPPQIQITTGNLPNFTNLSNVQLPDIGATPTPSKRGRKRKSQDPSVVVSEATNAELAIQKEDMYIDHYDQTNAMLLDTINEINMLSAAVQQDIETLRKAKNYSKKYEALGALNSNMGTFVTSKIHAITEMNRSIKEADNAQYRKDKDVRAIENTNDEKHVMDLYNAFISTPMSGTASRYDVFGPNQQQVMTGAVTRVDAYSNIAPGAATPDNMQVGIDIQDPGYQAYLSNMTPEQRLMRYENNPDVKQCVLFDRSTGAKRFAMMNLRTKEEIPGLPVHGNVILEDVTIDERNGIARNSHINETYPLIAYNQNDFNGF